MVLIVKYKITKLFLEKSIGENLQDLLLGKEFYDLMKA